jgi:hypothetical protein
MDKIICYKGAEEICRFVKEDPNQILHLVEHENLPAWKRNDKGTWRALNIDLFNWMVFQRDKYIKDTPKYFENK